VIGSVYTAAPVEQQYDARRFCIYSNGKNFHRLTTKHSFERCRLESRDKIAVLVAHVNNNASLQAAVWVLGFRRKDDCKKKRRQ
jgi:hypothetical protein